MITAGWFFICLGAVLALGIVIGIILERNKS